MEKIADIGDLIQKSSSEVGLQMAGLRFITKLLEEEPGQARQVIKADGGLTVRSVVLVFLPDARAAAWPLSVPLVYQGPRACSCGWKSRT